MFFSQEVEYHSLTELEKQKCENILTRLGMTPLAFFSRTTFSEREQILLLVVLLESGIDPYSLFNFLSWDKFERLVAMLFEQHGFESITNFRFKSEGSRHEIDILAFKYPYLYAIDCKLMKRQTSFILKHAAIKQKDRAEMLIASFPSYADHLIKALNLPSRRTLFVIPVIVSWYASSISVYENVPLVPFKQLIGFVREIDELKDDIWFQEVYIE